MDERALDILSYCHLKRAFEPLNHANHSTCINDNKIIWVVIIILFSLQNHLNVIIII